MSPTTYFRAFLSFSKTLDQVPQDALPEKLHRKAQRELAVLRTDPDTLAFGTRRGSRLHDDLSNLALGFEMVFEKEWSIRHPVKALFIDIHTEDSEQNQELSKAFEYVEERERYIATRMARLLVDSKSDIPEELRTFLGIKRGRGRERE